MTMTHPGLPEIWGLGIIIAMMLTVLWAMISPAPAKALSGISSLGGCHSSAEEFVI